MNVGDLVIMQYYDNELGVGVVLEKNINMWGEEVVPSGISVLWSLTNDCEVVYEDELVLIEYKSY
jgi:hypothetical protein